MDNLCTTYGSYTPEFLLSAALNEELTTLLCKAENEHIISDISHMCELDLFALFILLKNK